MLIWHLLKYPDLQLRDKNSNFEEKLRDMSKERKNHFIRLDWAMKRILRDKANFGVLEGFLSELLGEDIRIDRILESEGNKRYDQDKYNRVDLEACNDKGEYFIFEVQISRQSDFMERMLYGASRKVIDQLSEGDTYGKIKKVYSINVIYFDMGVGKDYIYHGTTTFRSYHDEDELQLTPKERRGCCQRHPDEFMPEYYLLRINEFNDVARTPLDEWIRYFKDGYISEHPTAKGLELARKKLDVMNLSPQEQNAYDDYMHSLASYEHDYNANMAQSREEGREEGIEIGREEGREKAIIDMVENMIAAGLSDETISGIAGVSPERIRAIRDR